MYEAVGNDDVIKAKAPAAVVKFKIITLSDLSHTGENSVSSFATVRRTRKSSGIDVHFIVTLPIKELGFSV